MGTTHPAQHSTCPRCGGSKTADLWLCSPCYVLEPRCCQRCRVVDVLLGGLCATCQADDQDADGLDPSEPIPYALTAQALALLRAGEVS